MRASIHRKGASHSQSASSPCRMEGLEPRLLLADELVIGIGDVVFKPFNIQLPDDKIDVPVTVQNVSGVQISGKIRIQIWASADDMLGGEDFLCFEGNINISVRPNAIQTKKVKSRLPLSILPNNYNFIATVIDDAMLPGGATFGTPEGVDDRTFTLLWAFGDVLGRSGNTTLKFMNDSGVIYKLNFSSGFEGSETGHVNAGFMLRGAGGPQGVTRALTPIVLTYENTGFDDKISVRRAGGPSDSALFYLTGIFSQEELRGASSPLGHLDAPDLTLYGPAEFEGGLHKLVLGNVTNAGLIEIDNEFDDRVSIKVKEVQGTIFDIDGVLANMKADSFSGLASLPEGSSVRGPEPFLGGITATVIDKVEIRNDFEGVATAGFLDQVLRGDKELPLLDGGRVVGKFIVGGVLTGGFFADGGNVARIQAGEIYDWQCSVQGRLERLAVEGGINNVPGVRGFPVESRIAACDFSRIDIGTNVNLCQIMAGAFVALEDTGEVFALEIFDGLDNVTFKPGSIGRINIGGDLFRSQIAAGVNANGFDYFNIDPFLESDSSMSRMGPIKVGGIVDMSQFYSGDFPDNVSINGASYNTMVDPDDVFAHVFPLV